MKALPLITSQGLVSRACGKICPGLVYQIYPCLNRLQINQTLRPSPALVIANSIRHHPPLGLPPFHPHIPLRTSMISTPSLKARDLEACTPRHRSNNRLSVMAAWRAMELPPQQRLQHRGLAETSSDQAFDLS